MGSELEIALDFDRHEVDHCGECAFFRDNEFDRYLCAHPIFADLLGLRPDLDPDAVWVDSEPPDWCPLRERPVLVVLRVES